MSSFLSWTLLLTEVISVVRPSVAVSHDLEPELQRR